MKFDEDGKEQILDAIKDDGVQQTVEIPQVQYLDTVFQQFIDQVVDISVVAQRLIPVVPVFPKTIVVPQLQYFDKEVDVAVVQFVQVRSVPEAREASTGAVLGHGCVGTRPCGHATTSSCSLLNSGSVAQKGGNSSAQQRQVRSANCASFRSAEQPVIAIGGVAAMMGFLHHCFFFALRPAGRRVPMVAGTPGV